MHSKIIDEDVLVFSRALARSSKRLPLALAILECARSRNDALSAKFAQLANSYLLGADAASFEGLSGYAKELALLLWSGMRSFLSVGNRLEVFADDM
ncbi:MAG: hypothetical protein QXT43_02265, partial [Candidatus Micrarchaeaceae archaeon]